MNNLDQIIKQLNLITAHRDVIRRQLAEAISLLSRQEENSDIKRALTLIQHAHDLTHSS